MTHPTFSHRALIVDDNQDAAISLGVLLRIAGYQVRTAFDGTAAIEIIRYFQPDVCILDINMPGMNGYELARRIRGMAPNHPPLMATVTAYGDSAHLDRAAEAGFDLHFTKPADVCDMILQLDDWLNR
jgi:two-component system, OmpR family, response regulator